MSVSLSSSTILFAISEIALMPSEKLAPECAAFPWTSISRKIPPLRPVTTLPEGRPGSPLKTKAALRANASMTSLLRGEPISSSHVNSADTSVVVCPDWASAAMMKAFMTTPAFMSATPGPYARLPSMRNGRLATSPLGKTVSQCPISRTGRPRLAPALMVTDRAASTPCTKWDSVFNPKVLKKDSSLRKTWETPSL